MKYPFKSEDLAGIILRAGLVFIFAYAGTDALREPAAWIAFFPPWISHFGPELTILHLFSFAQLLLTAALFWRPLVSYAAAIAALMLLGIGLFNLVAILVVFRDFGLVALALGLAVLEWPHRLTFKS